MSVLEPGQLCCSVSVAVEWPESADTAEPNSESNLQFARAADAPTCADPPRYCGATSARPIEFISCSIANRPIGGSAARTLLLLLLVPLALPPGADA